MAKPNSMFLPATARDTRCTWWRCRMKMQRVRWCLTPTKLRPRVGTISQGRGMRWKRTNPKITGAQSPVHETLDKEKS